MSTLSGPTLSSAGIGSGLDVNSIVTALVKAESQPLVQLQSKATQIQTTISSWGKVQSYVSAMRDAARALTDPTLWTRTAGSSGSPAVGVTTNGATLPGDYQVEVQALAAAQSAATATTWADGSATLGQGTLHIELGSWSGTTFSPKSGATAVDITIGPGEDTLAQVRDKINAAGAGVTASILTDASGARLVIRSSATGAANGFRIGVTETAPAGLAALAYDAAAAGGMTLAQAAQDARATINQIAVTSASNTLANVVDGVTLTLAAVTTAPASVSVKPDADAMKKAVTAFVSAYNDMAKYLTEQTKYDAGTKTAGSLQGDGTAVGVRSQLRAALGASSTASSVFTRLSDAGFDLQADGTIKLDDTKLSNALANVAEAKKLFSNVDAADPANNGVMVQLRTLADRLLGVDGSLGGRTSGLQSRLKDNQDAQARMQVRIDAFEARVRAQYTALDAQMGQMTSLSNYVTQQMTMLAKTAPGTSGS